MSTRKKISVREFHQKELQLFHEYMEFLRRERGLAQGTIQPREAAVLGFLTAHTSYATPTRIGRVRAPLIHQYIIKTAKSRSRDQRRQLVTALRDFFKFVYIKGYHSQNLASAVPTLITYRLERVPRALSWESVEQLLRVPDRRRPIGRRDYAILLLLATYGVRGIPVKNLRFKDIDWREGTIYFEAHKGGKPVLFPLERRVAEALLDYIKKDRRALSQPYVFVKHQTGSTAGQPLGRTLWFMVHRHLRKIGIDAPTPSRGPHALRHAVATRRLAEGQPIKIIADFWGHRSLASTLIYTKVDLEQLRSLARPWPEVQHETQ